MSQGRFVQSNWIGKLTRCLEELVSYERQIENNASIVKQRYERFLGIPSRGSHYSVESVRERVSGYRMLEPRQKHLDSGYQEYIAKKLRILLEVLLEHPTIRRSADFRNGEWILGLDLGVSRVDGFQMIFMLRGLVDYAIEHTPEATANALACMIQRGEDKNLSSYAILLFRGLHVESRYDFPNGLSIVSFEEARQYISEGIVRILLGGNGGGDPEPIGAVVFEAKWGPAFVPIGRSMEEDWPAMSETFRDDARLLVELLALTHELGVVSTELTTSGVERQIEYLVGRAPIFMSALRDVSGHDGLNVKPPTTPSVSEDSLSECAQLYSEMAKDDVKLRLALSRLASSLSRTGMHAPFDKIIDVAITLEVMYEIDVSRGKGGQLSRRARQLIGRDREDNKWIGSIAESLYDLRSDIAHGTLPRDTEQAYLDGLRLGRRTLAHLIRLGPPSDWDRR